MTALNSTLATENAGVSRNRLRSIDVLRGLVMLIMALDHVREMVATPHPEGFQYGDAPASLFFTRFASHLCAPTFLFLAGISAYLYGVKRNSRRDVAFFLLTRGLWLICAELTVVNFAWSFWLGGGYFPVFQVIWAIGASMIVLAGVLWLPRSAVLAIAVGMIVGHNLLDSIQPAGENISALWRFLHIRGLLIHRGGPFGFVIYPLIPWVNVMMLGYGFGDVFVGPSEQRARRLTMAGLLISLAFIVVRYWNGYGDANTWQVHASAVRTAIDFLDTSKYPPSLLYLLMTLGPACILLALFEQARGRWAEILAVFGRVPFLFYVTHLILSHLATYAIGLSQGFSVSELHANFEGLPSAFGLSLGQVYLAWLAIVVILYPLCRWFASVKNRRRDWWLSYL